MSCVFFFRCLFFKKATRVAEFRWTSCASCLGLGSKVIDGVSYAVPDDQSGKKHGHTSDTETAGDQCVYGNDGSVRQSGRISIRSLPSHSDMASLLHTHTHTQHLYTIIT